MTANRRVAVTELGILAQEANGSSCNDYPSQLCPVPFIAVARSSCLSRARACLRNNIWNCH